MPCCCSSLALQCERICKSRSREAEEDEGESEKVIDTNLDDTSSSSPTILLPVNATEEIEVKNVDELGDSEGSMHKDTERLN